MKHLIPIIFLSIVVHGETQSNPYPIAASEWTLEHSIIKPRVNPFHLPPEKYEEMKKAGQWHLHSYPIEYSVLLPHRAINKVLENDFKNPLVRWMQSLIINQLPYKSFDQVTQWLGFNKFPKESMHVPENEETPAYLGMTIKERYGAKGGIVSCGYCHSSTLFGKTIVGLTNRFPRANEFFLQSAAVFTRTPKGFYQSYTKSSPGEMKIFNELQTYLKSTSGRKPLALGLDTSLAQVSLSLNKRNQDAWATKNPHYEKNPRPDFLDSNPADSKPAVWWNVKYKNRWLSDGSMISGNPNLTNLLWNEIGRGGDLKQLDSWIKQNGKVIAEMATAVFSVEAPRITDFFSEHQIDINSAQRGETLFNESCAKCHGHYRKNWSLPEFETASISEKIKTYQVEYKKITQVKDVGTDPNRYLGMKSLEKLNALEISKNNGIVIQAQKGYVPPPLVGIWARWPYLHNNSVSNLCELLTPGPQRRKVFYQGPANDQRRDFDFDCNGYPAPEAAPAEWKQNPQYAYDTRIRGMGNGGHDVGIFIKNGQEILSPQDKRDLIHFLQTL